MIPAIALLIVIAGLVRFDWVRRRQALMLSIVLLVGTVLVNVLIPFSTDRDWIQFLAVVHQLLLLALILALVGAFWPEGFLATGRLRGTPDGGSDA